MQKIEGKQRQQQQQHLLLNRNLRHTHTVHGLHSEKLMRCVCTHMHGKWFLCEQKPIDIMFE